MPIHKLKHLLDSAGVKYQTITHSESFTAAETARLAHVPPEQIAKVVMVRIDDRMAMLVVPGNRVVDMEKLKEFVGSEDVRLANEKEFEDLFPECDRGAMPPFGNIYALPVYADQSLRDDDMICFNAGNHWELVKMPYSDWEKLVNPKIGSFTQPRLQRNATPSDWTHPYI